MSRALVTGGAGCIGSELAAALLARGDEVVVLDDFSSGRPEHIAALRGDPRFTLVEADLLDPGAVERAAAGASMVWHLAANPDVKFRAGSRTDIDLRQNTVGTFTVLEAMRRARVPRIVFASTSAVYGISERQPISEDSPCRPISLYGASKLACEGLLSAYCHLFAIEVRILRLANIVGKKTRRRGGTALGDFVARLREDPTRLRILGDGRQSKSYLTTGECVAAMLFVADRAAGPFQLYNLGGSDAVSVSRMAELVVEEMGFRDVSFEYAGGAQGWPGDVPRFVLDTARLNALGWRARLNSEQSVRLAIRQLLGKAP